MARTPPASLSETFDQLTYAARCALQQGDAALAQRLCQQVLSLHPRHSPTLLLLGKLAFEQGYTHDAAALLQQAVHNDVNDADAQEALGIALRGIGRLEASVDHLRIAARLRPYRVHTVVELAASLVTMEMIPDAEYWLARALQIEPYHPRASALLNELQHLPRAA
jgi:tetratricopeptide (TPR) repeat protein